MTSTTSHPKRVAFKTLGCKLNQAETESIAAGFKSLGWDIVDIGHPADAVIINSCTVTNKADRKSRQILNNVLRTNHDNQTLIVVAGCYADAYRESLKADDRLYVVGNKHKSRIPWLVEAQFKGEKIRCDQDLNENPFDYPTANKIFRTRAMVKVQDGCDNRCSFCIIPFVRGRAASRHLQYIVRSVENAVASGYREIVLTGVNIGRWQDGTNHFVDMLEACLNADGAFRLRLGSIEPDCIDNGLIHLMKHPKMTPHLHLCLQSGSEAILRNMKRRYTASNYVEIVKRLGQCVPGFNLTTDVIVGFPGETDEDFADTVTLCQDLPFGHIHTFPYSRRHGTLADRMINQVSPQIKRERAERIRGISTTKKRQFRETMIDSFQEVLVEKVEYADGVCIARGLSANYVPVRFTVVGNPAFDMVYNQMFRVRIVALDTGADHELIGARWGG